MDFQKNCGCDHSISQKAGHILALWASIKFQNDLHYSDGYKVIMVTVY
jgi:hypothetical protein